MGNVPNGSQGLRLEGGDLELSNLPLVARLIFQVWHKSGRPAGWAACHLFDWDKKLKAGPQTLRLFEGRACENPHATTLERRRSQLYEEGIDDAALKNVDDGAVLEMEFKMREVDEGMRERPVVWVIRGSKKRNETVNRCSCSRARSCRNGHCAESKALWHVHPL